MKSIIKYDNGRFNCGQALKDGWGLDWCDEKSLIGIELKDRKKSTYTVIIDNVDWFSGILRVWFKEGGWLCFDHAIQQFELK